MNLFVLILLRGKKYNQCSHIFTKTILMLVLLK